MRKFFIFLGAICAAFICGVLFADHHYRNIPLVQIYEVRSDAEDITRTKLERMRRLANTLVSRDAEIVSSVDDLLRAYDDRFNGGKPIDSDRLQDIENLEIKRQSIVYEINVLAKDRDR